MEEEEKVDSDGEDEEEEEEDFEDDDDDESSSHIARSSRRRNTSHQKTVSMLGDYMLAHDQHGDARSLLEMDEADLLKANADRQNKVALYYETVLKKTRKHGVHYYDRKHENPYLDGMMRHLTLRIEHDIGPFAGERLSTTRTAPGGGGGGGGGAGAGAGAGAGDRYLAAPPSSRTGTGTELMAVTAVSKEETLESMGLKRMPTRVSTTHQQSRTITEDEYDYYKKEIQLAIHRYRVLTWLPLAQLVMAAIATATRELDVEVKAIGYNLVVYLLPVSQLASVLMMHVLVQIAVLSCGSKTVVEEGLSALISAHHVTTFGFRFWKPIRGFALFQKNNALKMHNTLLHWIKALTLWLLACGGAVIFLDVAKPRQLSFVGDMATDTTVMVLSAVWGATTLAIVLLTVRVVQSLLHLSPLSGKSLFLKTATVSFLFAAQQLQFIYVCMFLCFIFYIVFIFWLDFGNKSE